MSATQTLPALLREMASQGQQSALGGERHLILFGGSFDPPHLGHLAIAEHAARELASSHGVSQQQIAVVVVPAAASPHKQSGPRASDAARLRMLSATFAQSNLRSIVWPCELQRPAPSYTIDTLRQATIELAKESRRNAMRLHLLLGGDQALALHAWSHPHELLTLAEPLIVPRPPLTDAAELMMNIAAGSGRAWSAMELAQVGGGIVAPLPENTRGKRTGSTLVRQLAANGDWAGLADHLAPGVIEQLRAANPYR